MLGGGVGLRGGGRGVGGAVFFLRPEFSFTD